MTALLKIPSKGVALSQSVSSVYVPMKSLTSITVAGRKVKTYDSTTLDTALTEENEPNGYVAAATIKASGFYNPTDATYTALDAIISTPTKTNFKVTWTDSGPTSQIYNGTAGYDTKVDPQKGVMADIEIQTTGNPS